MKKLTNVLVYTAGGYGKTGGDEVQVGGSNDVRPHLATFPVIHRRLGQPDEMQFSVVDGSAWSYDRALASRQRIYLVYDDASQEAYRIESVRSRANGGNVTVRCRALWADLAELLFRYVRATNADTTYWYPIAGRTLTDVLTIIFTTTYGMPSQFALGTIQSSIANAEIGMEANGTYLLELIRSAAQATFLALGLTCEFEVTYNAGTNQHTFNFYEEAGWTAAERSGGADPSLRPIEDPTGRLGSSTRNRLELDVDDEQDEYYSHLIPLAGSDEERVGIEDARFTLNSIVSVVAGDATLQFDDNVVWKDDCFNGLWLGVQTGTITGFDEYAWTVYEILDSIAPNQVVIDGDPSGFAAPGFFLRFYETSTNLLTFIPDPDAEAARGRVDAVALFRDHPPYHNWFPEQADLSDTYVGGLHPGLTLIGSPTASEETDNAFIVHGTSSQKIVGAVDEGVETVDLGLLPTHSEPFFSVWVAIRVEGDTRVRMTLVDTDDVEWPNGVEVAETESTVVRALSIGGARPATGGAGTTKLKFIIRAGTTFYIDAIVVTRSATPYPLVHQMGREGLFLKAIEEIQRSGGEQEPALLSEAIDLNWVDDVTYAIMTPGAHTRVRAYYSSGTWRLDETARIIETEEDTHPLQGFAKRVKVARKRPSLADRFRQPIVKHELPPAKGDQIAPIPELQALIGGGGPAQTESWYRVTGDAVIGGEASGSYGWTEGGYEAFDNIGNLIAVDTDGHEINEGFLTLTPMLDIPGAQGTNRGVFVGVYSLYTRGVHFVPVADGDYTRPLHVRWMWEWPGRPTALLPGWDDANWSDSTLVSHFPFDENEGGWVFDKAPPLAGWTSPYFAAMHWSILWQAVALGEAPDWGVGGLVFDGGIAANRAPRVVQSFEESGGTNWTSILPGSQQTPWDWKGSEDFTIIIACKAHNQVDGNQKVVIKHASNNLQPESSTSLKFGIWFVDGKVRGGYHATNGTTYYAESAGTYTDGEWHVFTLRKSGLTIDILVDDAGVVGSNTLPAHVTTNATNRVYLGASQFSTNAYVGTIGYLRVHRGGLTLAAVNAEANEMKTRVESRDVSITFPGF